MTNEFIEVIDINDNRIAIELDSIKGYIEQKDVYYTREGSDEKYKADDHCIVVTAALGNIRIKDTYDKFAEKFEDAQYKRNLNI